MTRNLTITDGTLVAEILTLGATLTALRMRAGGPNLVLGFASPSDHLRYGTYAGAIVGPIANRISDGHVTIDGTTHQMQRNENGQTALHSGDDGLHAMEWDVIAHQQDFLHLQVQLQDGRNGLPGLRDIDLMYHMKSGALNIDIKCKTSNSTPINIAHHPYWNLDADGDIAGHRLWIDADHYLPTDGANLPTGARTPVSGTAFDFTKPAPIPLSPDLDVNFCLAEAPRAQPVPCATLVGSNGTTLEVETTAPGLQAYGGAFLPRVAGALSECRNLQPFAGIALEPQMWPDAPHHIDFPNIILDPGDIWHQKTKYRLTP